MLFISAVTEENVYADITLTYKPVDENGNVLPVVDFDCLDATQTVDFANHAENFVRSSSNGLFVTNGDCGYDLNGVTSEVMRIDGFQVCNYRPQQ